MVTHSVKDFERSRRSGDNSAILVTGGSGFVGKHVVKKLAEDEQTVVCMYHHRLPEPMANVYPVCSDMGSSELIAAPLRGVNTVIHLAWEGSFVGSNEKLNWTPESQSAPKNIRLLKNLIAAMEKAGTRRLVFLSAIGANRYAKTRFLQEKYLAEFFILNSKIPEKIILRSTLVCGGSNDKFLRSIINVMQFPVFYPVPQRKEMLSPLHIKDLSKIISDAATVQVTKNCAILELRGQEDFKVDEVFKMVSEKFAKGTKFAVRGVIGNALLPLFERDSRRNHELVRLRDYLAIGSSVDASTQVDNPLANLVPEKLFSFKDILAEN